MNMGNAVLAVQGAIQGFSALKSFFNSGSAKDVGTLSDEELRAELKRIEQEFVAGRSVPQWAIDRRKKEVEDELRSRQEKGGRIYGGTISTLTEASGHQIVANTASILAELQNGHLRTINESIADMRGMLAAGINIRTSNLTTSMATDATTRTRSSGL